MLKALMGPINFDSFFAMYEAALGDELISFWQNVDHEQRYGALSKLLIEAFGDHERLKKGSFAYFPNAKKNAKKYPFALFSGEHVACIGKKIGTDIAVFMGFGSFFQSSKSEQEINDHLFAEFINPLTVRE